MIMRNFIFAYAYAVLDLAYDRLRTCQEARVARTNSDKQRFIRRVFECRHLVARGAIEVSGFQDTKQLALM
jgi:hypothetical protein